MNRRLAPLVALVLVAALAASCAVTYDANPPGAPAAAPATQDPARIGLPPEYRVFFDDLRDDGDWTLIEPYGWCFRPRVNFTAWRPYQEGWWEPSDYYGWIWNSTESFGWITYHYGNWFYDEYQGWVWQPGPVWGPAWVAWVSVGNFIGWAPLAPARFTEFDRIPGGVFTYATASQLGSRGLGDQTMFVNTLPARDAPMHMIDNYGRVGGITINRGPDFASLQRLGGVVMPHAGAQGPRKLRLATAGRANEAELVAGTRRLVAVGSNELRIFREQGTPPPPAPARTPLPGKVRARDPEPGRERADSTRVKPSTGGGHGAPRDTSDHRDVRRTPSRER